MQQVYVLLLENTLMPLGGFEGNDKFRGNLFAL